MSDKSNQPSQQRPRIRGVWPGSPAGQPHCITTSAELELQLAWIDKRIERSQQHAATSNRAKGAVREWTQKREALLRAAAEAGLGTDQPRQR